MESSHLENKSSLRSSTRRAATAGYFGSFIIFGLLSAAIGPTLPGLAQNTGSDLSQISLIFTAQALGYLVGSLSGGRLFDRMPGHRLLSVVLLIMGCMAFLIPLIPNLWLLLAVFLLLGNMQGVIEVGNNTLLVWLYRVRVGPYMNALHFFFGLGAILSPLIIARTASVSGNIAWAYWILALLTLPIALWLGRLPSPKAYDGEEPEVKGELNVVLIGLVAVLLFLYVGAEASYGGWVYTYTISQFPEVSASSAALLTSAFWAALTVGRLVSIPLAVRIKPGVVLVGDLLGCLLSIGAIVVYPNSLAVVWVGTLSLGFFMASFFPTTLTLAGQRMQISGKVSGWFFVGAGAGGMFLPWLIGQLFEVVGPGITVSLILADLLVALGALVVFLFLTAVPREQRLGSTLEPGS